jgi:RNA polymerase sigma factor (sigma-70 family)
MATRGVTGPGTADDGSLQTAAIGGDGHAFAELYDRHERRVYGFCLRMLGTPHDAADATQETFLRMLQRLPALEGRELNFAAYALKVARNACYDALDVRKRVEPVSDHDELPLGPVPIDDDPERAAMLSATREQVQAANASLPPAQREVLALREVESLSYAQIGEIIGLKENAVAQLISRARIGLRNAVRGSALSSVGASSADCARAIPLLAAVQDGQDAELEELSFLHAHLATCDTCRLRREAMEEAGVSYRALPPSSWSNGFGMRRSRERRSSSAPIGATSRGRHRRDRPPRQPITRRDVASGEGTQGQSLAAACCAYSQCSGWRRRSPRIASRP